MHWRKSLPRTFCMQLSMWIPQSIPCPVGNSRTLAVASGMCPQDTWRGKRSPTPTKGPPPNTGCTLTRLRPTRSQGGIPCKMPTTMRPLGFHTSRSCMAPHCYHWHPKSDLFPTDNRRPAPPRIHPSTHPATPKLSIQYYKFMGSNSPHQAQRPTPPPRMRPSTSDPYTPTHWEPSDEATPPHSARPHSLTQ